MLCSRGYGNFPCTLGYSIANIYISLYFVPRNLFIFTLLLVSSYRFVVSTYNHRGLSGTDLQSEDVVWDTVILALWFCAVRACYGFVRFARPKKRTGDRDARMEVTYGTGYSSFGFDLTVVSCLPAFVQGRNCRTLRVRPVTT